MSLKLGALDVLDARLGTVAVARLVLGTEQVWPSGPLTPTGRVLAVESPDTAEIVGTVLDAVVGLVAAVEGPHVAAVAGIVTLGNVTATIAVIEADDLASIVGTSTAPPGVVVGAVVVVEADDLAAVVGTVAAPVYTGTIVAVDDDDLAAIVGTTTAPVYTGAIVAVEADAFAAVVGTSSAPVYTGAISIVEADDVATIDGAVTVPPLLGAVAVTEADDTSVIDGTSSVPVYTGTISATEEADTSTIAGISVEVVGAVAVTELADTSVIAGTFTAPAFPTIATVNNEVGTSMGAQAINMPTGITAGDLLIAVAVNDNPSATVMTASAGWTEIRQQVQGANVMRLAAFGRIADGTATDNITITGAAQDYAAFTARITGHGLTGISGIFVADANAATGNGDPPNLVTDSDRGWLWLAVEGVDLTTGSVITSVPSGYTSQFNNVSASSTSSVALAVGSRTAAGVTTENPATFTNNPTTRPWVAFTIGIPASAPAAITGAVAVTEADDASVIAGTAGAAGVIFADNFNRADGAIGSAWVGTWVVSGNTAHRGSTGADGEITYYATPVATVDHWVEADVTPGTDYMVVNARGDAAQVSSNRYLGFVSPAGQATIGKLTAGTYADVNLGTTGLTTTGTYKLRLEVEGSAQRLYYNGSLVATGADTAHSTGPYVGLNASQITNSADNFRAGPLPYTP